MPRFMVMQATDTAAAANEPSDEALMALVAQGDEGAFRRLAAATVAPQAEHWALADARVSYGMCGVLRQIDDFQPG